MAYKSLWAHTTSAFDSWFDYPNANIPTWLTSAMADFSIWWWMKSDNLAGDTAFRTVLGLDLTGATGGWMVFYRSSQIGFRLYLDDGTNIQAALSVPGTIEIQDIWTLCGAHVDVTNKEIKLVAVNSDKPSGVEASTTWSAPRVPGSGGGDYHHGNRVAGALRSYEGALGLTVMRKGEIVSIADAVALYNGGDPKQFDLVNRNAGNMGGPNISNMVMLGHSICQNPDGGGNGPYPGDDLDTIGAPACPMYIQSTASHDMSKYEDLNGAVVSANATRNVGVDDVRAYTLGKATDGVDWATTVPGLTTDGVKSVGEHGLSAFRLNQDTPTAADDRILVWSNSRGGRITVGGGTHSGNHANGFLFGSKTAQMRGCLLHSFKKDGGNQGFGFDWDTSLLSTGTTEMVYGPGSGYGDLERAFCNQQNTPGANATGTGMLCRLAASSTIHARAKEETGTLFLKSKIWDFTVYCLAFPGSTDALNFTDYEATTLTAAGTARATTGGITGLDTEVTTRTYTTGAGDLYTAGTPDLVVFVNLVAAGIQAGDLVVIKSGTGLGSAAYIDSISWDGTKTTLGLHNAFETAPDGTSVFSFGPWSIQTLQYSSPASLNTWRGPRLEPGISGMGVFVFAIGVETNAEAGFVIGPVGLGGQGYGAQPNYAWPTAISKTVVATGATEVWLHNATQSSSASDMLSFASILKADTPLLRIVLLSDMQHKDDTIQSTWQDYMLNTQGAYSASGVMESTALGNRQELWAKGWYYDEAHPNDLGMIALSDEHITNFATIYGAGSLPGGPNSQVAPRAGGVYALYYTGGITHLTRSG